jgi:hypothetical protein
MGTLGNGDGGPFDDLPEFPPEWGQVRIPDDASELAEEAAQVRRELRERERAATPGLRASAVGAGRRGPAVAGPQPPTEPTNLRVPLMIMSAALLAALISLVAVAWPGDRRQPATERTAKTTSSAPAARRSSAPALDLVGTDGKSTPLSSLLPAAIMLLDECAACDEAVASVAKAAPPGVTVIALTRAPMSPAGAGPPATANVRRLGDPGGAMRGFVHLSPAPQVAPVVLVASTGEVVRVVEAGGDVSGYVETLVALK